MRASLGFDELSILASRFFEQTLFLRTIAPVSELHLELRDRHPGEGPFLVAPCPVRVAGLQYR